jgi:mannosyltransferase OCH1-like enzyme
MLRSTGHERVAVDVAKQAERSTSKPSQESRRTQNVVIIIFILLVVHQLYAACSSNNAGAYIIETIPSSQEVVDKNPVAHRQPQIVKRTRNQSNSSIPPILHFIHITEDLNTDNDVPQDVTRNIRDWQAMHPHWKIFTWTNADIRREFDDLMKLLSKIPGPRAWISDILRYKIILDYGGIYLDTDIVPIHPLDPLLALQNFTVCESPYRHEESVPSDLKKATLSWDVCDKACNAVIGASKDNPALQFALMRSRVNTRTALDQGNVTYALKLSGPAVWTRVAKKLEINVLHEKTFYPCHFGDVAKCKKANFAGDKNTFAMHLWAKSWKVR